MSQFIMMPVKRIDASCNECQFFDLIVDTSIGYTADHEIVSVTHAIRCRHCDQCDKAYQKGLSDGTRQEHGLK